jgi:putative Holliday junction resolvase
LRAERPDLAAVRSGVRLAVDVGSVRVGVAASDPEGILASPLAVLPRRKASGAEGANSKPSGAEGANSKPSGAEGANSEHCLGALADLVTAHNAVEVIVGLPTTLSGREGQAAIAARSFAGKLATRIAPVPVRLFDERFTTTTAHEALRRGGKDSRARRAVVDQAAAAVLLQAALEAERRTGRPQGQLVNVTSADNKDSNKDSVDSTEGNGAGHGTGSGAGR